MSAWQRLDEGTGRAILVFSGPTTAADILFQLIGGIEPGHAAKIVVSALYFHPYVDLSREDSDHNPAPPPAADPTAAMLELFLKGELPAAELAITYSDLHQLHGGLELTIHGDGTVEQQVLREEPGEPHDLSRAQVEELVRLLLEFEVWEQRVPERMPVPDESRAYLKVAAGEVESEIWEWHNDLEAGDRLIRIRKRMKQLAWR